VIVHREFQYSLKSLVLYFLKLGATGFGGPIALVGHMEQDLVEDRKWIGREEFERGFALAQLAPGPVAAQLAMYIGYLRGQFIGATLIAVAFLLPSFIMVVVLGMCYVEYGGLDWVHTIFTGVGAAVIGIIARSAYKLSRSNLKKVPVLWAIFGAMALLDIMTQVDLLWFFLLGGVVAIAALAPPRFKGTQANAFAAPGALGLLQLFQQPDIGIIGTIFLFFAKAGTFVFGSGLTIVPFLHPGVVQQNHWLTEQQFMDAVSVAMITPGPVVITVGFIGYLIAGFPGAVAAALGVFLPVYIIVVTAARFVEKISQNLRVMAFVKGVTAAATGAIAGSVVVLAREAITDVSTAIIAVASLLLIARARVPDPIVIVLAALAGFTLHYFGIR
jgi:chromate transporter